MSTGRIHVFAYGSNLDPGRMASRVPGARVVGRARLAGFELRFHKRGSKDGTGKANAFETGADGVVVHGVIYEVDEDGLAALDGHEGGYDRRLVRLEVEGRSGGVDAWVYVARPELVDDALTPADWYLEHVAVGARTHGLPDALIAELRALNSRSRTP